MAWEIKDLPCAPSANKLHVNVVRGGKIGFRRNSGEYQNFQHQMSIYELSNRKHIKAISEWAVGRNFSLQLEMYFQKTKVLCLDGRVKKFDHHNLLKAQIDELCKMIGVDDSRIWHVSASKIVSANGRSFVNAVLMDLDEVSE